MIDPTAKLSVSRQAIVLGISRGGVYYQPRPVPAEDQARWLREMTGRITLLESIPGAGPVRMVEADLQDRGSQNDTGGSQ